jgi:glycosyltransferase involved in cell wall biosynthesis
LLVVENHSVPRDRRVWPEALALRDSGFQVEVICPAGTGYDEELHEERDGIAIFRFRCPSSDGSTAGYLREYGTAMWRISRLARRRASIAQFDVVHAANPPDFVLPALWPLKRHGTRFVFDHHDLAPELYAERFRPSRLALAGLRLLERATFRIADVVLATNDSYRRLAITRGRVDPERVFVVRNGPDARRLVPEEPERTLKRGARFLLVYVGLIEPHDGVDIAVEALARLRRRRDDWRALIVGDGGGLHDARERTGELGLNDVVEFPGFIDDPDRLRRILASADVCLSPEPKSPLNEASTLIKVAEYMAMAKPVVAFDLSETRATAGAAAVYATPNDPRSYAAAIEALLDDPQRRARMGKIARARVEEQLSWEHSKRALARAYACALESSNGHAAGVGA